MAKEGIKGEDAIMQHYKTICEMVDGDISAEVISTEGMSVLPGLWDMHVHLMINGHSDYDHWDSAYMKDFEKVIMPASAHQLLMAGVTSARDLGGPLEASINVKKRIDHGDIPGPTLYVSGPFIQHKPYPHTEAYRWGVNGVEDARAKVRKIAEAEMLKHYQSAMSYLRKLEIKEENKLVLKNFAETLLIREY